MNRPDLIDMEIHSQAPVRVSFAGGGTDVTPFPEQHGGMVVNATISTFMTARLRLRKDRRVVIQANTRREPLVYAALGEMDFDGRLDFVKVIARKLYKAKSGFELYLHSAVPMRSGLGGSGAMCVAVEGVFNHLLGHDRRNNYELAELAYRIETNDLHNASGRQDQYAATFGGINHVEFLGESFVRVNPIHLDKGPLRHLGQSLSLLWLGERPAASGGIIEDQTRGLARGGDVLAAMKETRKHVIEMREAIRAADIRRVGWLLDMLWAEKKRFSDKISSPRIDAIYAALKEAGMIGGKITGAGGGGHMLACCDLRDRDRMLAAAEQMQVKVVPFEFVFDGLVTWQAPVFSRLSEGRYVPAPMPRAAWATS